MRKSQIVPIVLLSSLIFAFSASAGEWKKDPSGWRYDNGGGNYSARTWQWIDGNGDGIAECYYFDISGYAPDQYDHRWIGSECGWCMGCERNRSD
ncbi:hypothetical protein ACTQ56_13095 [[Clostridium] aminophilum]|uniref:hypothetical protein n=1 Tax=[Clostridium] aminophilum TaxID=1526 RepID=UPI0026EECD50|nr:hypothetical protein [[Clostridium] aminophilum]MDD6196473.1 hypothetical protein [[Clostridium] aminophilum]